MKKIIILIILIAFSNEIKAEHFFDFYLQDLDLSSYPIIKVKGGVINYETKSAFFEGQAHPENITFSENNNEVEIDVSSTYINKNVQIFTITYTTELPEKYVRKFSLEYDRYGFHNGGPQIFSYNPKEHRYIKEIGAGSDEALGVYINNFIIDYDRDGLQEMYVLARNGLLVRESPTTNAKLIGKLDFGQKANVSLIQYGEEISLVENEKMLLEIEGKYRKITYKGKEGYVFDGYLTVFSFFNFLDKDDLCNSISNIPGMLRPNLDSRVILDYDTYGEHLLFKHIPLQELY